MAALESAAPHGDWLRLAGAVSARLDGNKTEAAEASGQRLAAAMQKADRVCAAGPVLLVLLLSLSVQGGGGTKNRAGLVTCGSVLKLLNTHHRVRLHSHDIKYGSGSGQQSVTGVEASDDANSYWRIRGGPEGACPRGVPVRCGQTVRLTHVLTGKNLHTHHFSSPLSNNQEVSAFGEDGEGDDLDLWTVRCSGQHWEREASVRFQHVGTSVFLSITGEQYGSPIRGQLEVHGMTSANSHNTWKVMEGVFIKPSLVPSTGHDEL
ncbi:PREDICTED: stromal cell-derived factor 2-like protein 1 [Elephantulus edwardii]|uniref:stromal cell-derived factor 2-like protein 1 n=1 Tax=Elephantulus edwardii TaxID=28737 RepID=UPI0003F0D09D|nr:PREDICTED: stromal cell-derived factor 2-like protein 1 [Elephantulus edwardii]